MDYNVVRKLNKRVTLREEANVPDGAGGYTQGWSDVATVWAGVEPKRADEYLRAEGLANDVTHLVTIRYRAGVEPDMEVKFGDRQFRILSVVNPREAKRYLELVCKELVP